MSFLQTMRACWAVGLLAIAVQRWSVHDLKGAVVDICLSAVCVGYFLLMRRARS